MIILALDMGEKRVGVAKSDELGMFAHSVGFIPRDNEEKFIKALKEIIEEFNPEKIIVGLPINLDGTHGIACEKIFACIDELKKEITVPIETWDERLTTKEAMRYMQGSSLSGSKKRKKVDALAAKIMLQGWLDCNR